MTINELEAASLPLSRITAGPFSGIPSQNYPTMTDQAVEEALNAPVEQLAIASSSRPSSPEPKSGSHLNGKKHSHTAAANEDVVSWPADDDAGSNVKVDGHGSSRVRELEQELARTREERDGLEGQYKGLLGKLTQMRSTLGDRLRQDAVSLQGRFCC